MANPIEELFSDPEQVKKTLLEARDTFGSKTTTPFEYDAMIKTLGFALFYCPEDMKDLVESHIFEAGKRYQFFEKTWKEKLR